jgi:hypothetical protein
MTPPIPSPMIEQCRVAALVALAVHAPSTDIQELLLRGSSRGDFPPGALNKMIRAVLETLLNPTPEMIEAGASVLPEFHWDTDEDPAQVASVWQAMLHTALGHTSEGKG